MSLIPPRSLPWIARTGILVAFIGLTISLSRVHRPPEAHHPSPTKPIGKTPGMASNPPVTQVASNSGDSRAVPALDEDLVMQGRYVFERQCMACHGRWGDGRGELAEGMLPKPRRLTSGLFKFRSTPSGYLPTDGDLARTIRGGIANSSMPSFAHLPSRDLAAVITYAKTLSSRWRHGENRAEPMALGEEPDWFYDDTASSVHRHHGEGLFQANCAGCHSAANSGLVDQWGDPCPAPNLATAILKCGGEPADVYRILATGMDGTPMPSFESGLSATERWEVVAYLRGLRQRGKPGMDRLPSGSSEGDSGEPSGSK